MSEFKGTPGNFKACISEASWYGFENKFFEVVDQNNMIIAFVKDWHGAGEAPKKDALLLAAAPELLEACLRIQAQLRQAGITSVAGSLNPAEDSAAQIDAAILKALGE